MTVLRNPDHVTIAVANAATAVEFFEVLGFWEQQRKHTPHSAIPSPKPALSYEQTGVNFATSGWTSVHSSRSHPTTLSSTTVRRP